MEKVAKTLIAGVLLVAAACPAEGPGHLLARRRADHLRALHGVPSRRRDRSVPADVLPRRAAARVADRRRHDAPCDAAVEAARRGRSVRRCAACSPTRKSRTIREWAAQGAVEGNAADLPPLPEWRSAGNSGHRMWSSRMPEPYMLRAEGPDVFRTFVLPIPTDSARYVRAVEFNPGNARAVHHANFGIDRTRSSRHLDGLRRSDLATRAAWCRTPRTRRGTCSGGRPVSGRGRRQTDAAWRLEPGSDVVVQLHMQPTGKPEPVQVSVGAVLHRSAADANARRNPAGQPDDRHRRRQRVVRHHRQLSAAG